MLHPLTCTHGVVLTEHTPGAWRFGHSLHVYHQTGTCAWPGTSCQRGARSCTCMPQHDCVHHAHPARHVPQPRQNKANHLKTRLVGRCEAGSETMSLQGRSGSSLTIESVHTSVHNRCTPRRKAPCRVILPRHPAAACGALPNVLGPGSTFYKHSCPLTCRLKHSPRNPLGRSPATTQTL